MINKWLTILPLDIARSHPSVAVYKDVLYVFGGGGPQFKSLNSSVCYDPKTKQWRALSPMPSLRSGTVAVTMGQKIYVMGGGFKQENGQFRFLKTVEIYDPQQDRWEQGPDLLEPHDYPAVAVLNDEIYVMGGHHPEGYREGPKTDPGFDFCEKLNLELGRWQAVAPLPTPRFALAAVTYKKSILTFGGVAFSASGFNNYDFVEVYDAEQDQWFQEQRYQLPWTAAGLGACTANEQIYIFGGYSGDGIHAGTAKFDGHQWQVIEPMPTPRAAMGVGVLSDGMYLIGGWADDGRTPIHDVSCLTY